MSQIALRITEIFHSLQGESTFVGLPTVFVRLTGCPLRCQYCDTAYAFSGGEMMLLDAILKQINQFKTPYVTVTGGEPLAQKDCLILLKTLCDQAKTVSLETSGALSVADIDPRVIKIMDLKTPDSNEMDRNDWSNLDYLNKQDQIKFVICSRKDYDWSKEIIDQYQLNQVVSEILFSPSHHEVDPKILAEWILQDQLPVRMQVQLHKYLWDDEPGH